MKLESLGKNWREGPLDFANTDIKNNLKKKELNQRQINDFSENVYHYTTNIFFFSEQIPVTVHSNLQQNPKFVRNDFIGFLDF